MTESPAATHVAQADEDSQPDRANIGVQARPQPPEPDTAIPADATQVGGPHTDPIPDQSDQPRESDERQQAWNVLRHLAQKLKPIGVYRILENDPDRTQKERANGNLTTEDEQSMRAAHQILGNSPHAIYRNLRTPEAPSASAPDHGPQTALQSAPRPEMPTPCTCEDTTTAGHQADCPDGRQ